MNSTVLRRPLAGVLALVSVVALVAAYASPAEAGSVPPGFQETEVFSGLTQPTSVAFAPDGRVFVAEKSGVIDVFSSVSDTTPTVFADLSNEVFNYWDRGLLGMVLDPEFPTRPYVYVLYTRDAEPGEANVPKWGGTSLSDGCPSPPGPTANGCVVTGRLSKLTASGDSMVSETPLITDWCQQFPSHSIGDLAFGPEGDLFISGGEGANFNNADWGEVGEPRNPCGDPPGGIGGTMILPTAEGGALRAQDIRTQADPTGLDGSVLRVDPETGAGIASNPLGGSSDANARRIIAYGFRNPFRFTLRPGTNEVWVGDVGWGTWEEINQIKNPAASSPVNFGWPCYEGGEDGVSVRQEAYDALNLNLCEVLYEEGPAAVRPAVYAYEHGSPVVPGESCPTGSSSTSGLAFYNGSSFPSRYDDALFFADYSRNCIWAMLPGADGLPDPSKIESFDEGAAAPVNLIEGPDGSLYFPDLTGGKVWRIAYSSGNQYPVARATASPSFGLAPLTVQFDAGESSDADPGDTLSYAWDLDGDGQFDDSTEVSPEFTYTDNGTYAAKVKVMDDDGASDIASTPVQVGNTPPAASITSPSSSLTWAVGDEISYSATALDAQDGSLPASAYQWKIIMHHCPSNCHEHILEEVAGKKSGTIVAPDHEYPSWLELELTVTDSGGLTDTRSVEVHPQTVNLHLESSPAGVKLNVNDEAISSANSSVTLIKGSTATVIAASPQSIGGRQYVFESWSDGGAAGHDVVVGQDENLRATFVTAPDQPSIEKIDPASPGRVQTPAVSGALGARAGSTVEVFLNSSCVGAPAASGSAQEFTGAGIPVSVPANASTSLSADSTNAAGSSACSKAVNYVEDSLPPRTKIVRPAARRLALKSGGKKAAKTKRIGVTFRFAASEPTLRFECSLDRSAFSECISPMRYPKVRLGQHRFSARAVDLAGNAETNAPVVNFAVVKKAQLQQHRSARRRCFDWFCR